MLKGLIQGNDKVWGRTHSMEKSRINNNRQKDKKQQCKEHSTLKSMLANLHIQEQLWKRNQKCWKLQSSEQRAWRICRKKQWKTTKCCWGRRSFSMWKDEERSPGDEKEKSHAKAITFTIYEEIWWNEEPRNLDLASNGKTEEESRVNVNDSIRQSTEKKQHKEQSWQTESFNPICTVEKMNKKSAMWLLNVKCLHRSSTAHGSKIDWLKLFTGLCA